MARSYVRRTDALAIDRIREIWDYDADTGVLRWKRSFRGIAIGAVAGKLNPDGSRAVTFEGRTYQVTRVAWLHHYGVEPEGHVVPINGDRSDTRIVNLKEQPRAETVRSSAMRSTNKSGYRGVSKNNRVGKWVASVTRDYRRVHLGFYDTAEEASAAVERALAEGLAADKGSVLPRKPMDVTRKRWISRSNAEAKPTLIGFDTFDALLTEVGEQPTEHHVLTRIDLRKALGPGNVAWRLPWPKGGEKRRYHHAIKNIDTSMFERELAAQGGVCAICRQLEMTLPSGKVKDFAADHNHATHKQRGALCMVCNSVLGLFDEDPARFRRAADYLEMWTARHAAEAAPIPIKDSA
jgi:Recombination endonuclease VII/HNH endonuclease/AP2 domain